MASLIQQRDLYYVQFYDGDRPVPRKRIALKTKDEQVARRLKARAEDAFALGVYDPWRDGREHEIFGWTPPPETNLADFEDAAEAFLEEKRASTRPGTVSRYEDHLQTLGVERTKNLTAEAIRSAQKESWSAATTNSHRRHIGVFCRWLMDKGWLERDPTKEIPVRPTRDSAPKHITRAERWALIRYVQARGQRTGGDGRYSSYAFLARFLQINPLMGLRPKPALHLKWADVNLQDRIAHVRSAKGGKSRTVPVAERAQRALQSMPKDSPFVYGGAGYWKATRALRSIRDELGMGEHVTLYATRHSYGTWLAEAGVPVHQIKRLMGHSSIQVTQRYMHASPEQGQRYVDAAFA